ncbi:MAG: endolytic transglycosylase MltG [Bacteroidota bacterium]
MKSKTKKTVFISVTIIFAVMLGGLFYIYNKLIGNHVIHDSREETYIHIPTGCDFNQALQLLEDSGLVDDPRAFRWMALQMKYDTKVKPGRYKITKGMSSRSMLLLLRSGKQSPVKLRFQNIRTTKQLAGVIGKQIEADSIELAALLQDSVFLEGLGFTKHTAATMFIPNTYECYWNTDARKFIDKMKKEYDRFWNERRLASARGIGLTPAQVSTLASIVEKETAKNDEKPTVAGVYMNRLQQNWKLEADPTLIFAANDFTIRRVLNKHKEIDSPFNTYKYMGLPPGPICIPSIASIDAVLAYKRHEYMFFCAKEDFSGYHNFAVTYTEHLANARKFQDELNRRNIRS